ncbi:hypothetical protein EDC56_2648 [Sinobacterium caligoides]|uniref:Uncharacterized protein n=1 Tax=Sinobacterium caligoides TaxID=933926 RepID=A0A3N2DJN2_9GAMM|nr:hypothetical protein EDC56_2648 [Sinobacterium caligoides]
MVWLQTYSMPCLSYLLRYNRLQYDLIKTRLLSGFFMRE